MKKILYPLAVFTASLPHALVAQNKLEEVVVTSSRFETPLRALGSSVSVMEREEIELRGYTSVFDLMRNLPGISVTNSGGAGKQTSLRIRGEEGYRTLVMIDGVEISDPTGTQVRPQIQHLANSSDIERIEVLRGPQGFIYGADAGGVINIFTRATKEGVAGQVAAEYGRYETQKFNVFAAQGSELGDVFVSVADQKTDGFNTRTEDTSGEEDGYENTTFHGKLGWNIDKAYRAQLVIRDVTSESEFDQCFGTDFCESEFDQTTARLSLTYSGERSEQTIGYSQTDVKRNSLTGGVVTFSADGAIYKADYSRKILLDEIYTLVYGLDVEQEQAETTFSDDIDRDQLGAYSEIQANFNQSLYITAGLRYDDHEDFGDHFSVRVGSAYVLPSSSRTENKLRASIGSGFRAPSISEISYNLSQAANGTEVGDPLTEEKTSGAELGLDSAHDNGTFASVTLFYQTIEDEIDFGPGFYVQTSGESESRGVEISVEYPLVSFLSLNGNVTYNETEQRDGLPRVRRPEKFGNLGLHFSLLENKLTILANARFVRDSVDIVFDEFFNSSRVALENYEVFDLSANYRLNDQLELFGRVENLSDKKYHEITNYNTAGASAYAGVRYDF